MGDTIFEINVTDRIEFVSHYNFDKYLDVIIYNRDYIELYRTTFPFEKNITYWIGINQLENIIINIKDEEQILYYFDNLTFNDDFVYVTCGDLYYMNIIEKLVISLLNSSTRKIIVYSIDCNIPFYYSNMIKRKIKSEVKSQHDKWFWKQEVCVESIKENFNNYVWVDGDIIVNNNIDSVSKYFEEIDNYPLCDVHVHDDQIFYEKSGESQLMGEKICKYYGFTRKVTFKNLHACFFVYNKDCNWFFVEMLFLYKDILNKVLYDELLKWNDESLHNFMHSKYNFIKTLPLSNLSLLCSHSKYESNPKVLELFYGYWNDESPNNFGEKFGWSYVPEDKNQILYFHENKNLKDADEMIDFIKKMKNR